MSFLTVSGVNDWVRDYIPGIPQSKVVRKLNQILGEIHEEIAQVEWTTFTTRAPNKTGTVNVVAGSSAVAFSVAVLTFPNTQSLLMLKVDDDPNGTWFVLTPTSAFAGTLSSVYAGPTNAVATFTIVYPTVLFPPNVGQITYVERKGTKLLYATRENAEMRASSDIVGVPRWFGPYAHDSTAASTADPHRLILTPFPDDAYSHDASFMQRAQYLGTSDAPSTKIDLPSLFDRPVLYGTLALCWSQEDGESKFGPWWGRYTKALQHARATGTAQVGGPRSGTRGQRRGRSWEYRDRYTIGGP